MRYRTAALFFIAAYLLQSSVLRGGGALGVAPDLVLCLTVMSAFLYENRSGAVFGVLFGLAGDLAFSPVVGPAALGYLAVALAMGELRYYLYRDSLLSVGIATVSGTLIFYFILWGIQTVFGGTYHILAMLGRLPLLLVFHLAVNIGFYLLVGRRSMRHPQDRSYTGTRLYLR